MVSAAVWWLWQMGPIQKYETYIYSSSNYIKKHYFFIQYFYYYCKGHRWFTVGVYAILLYIKYSNFEWRNGLFLTLYCFSYCFIASSSFSMKFSLKLKYCKGILWGFGFLLWYHSKAFSNWNVYLKKYSFIPFIFKTK